MRDWKCCPPSSTHFWHLSRKSAFTKINSISEIESISRLILSFGSSNVWGFTIFIYGRTWKIKCIQRTPHIRRTESKYQAWNWLYFGNSCKCTFSKKVPKMCGWRRTTFPTSYVIRCVIIFLCNCTNCRPLCSGVLLSVCRPGLRLSAVVIASRHAAGDT